jgi:predicted DNA-binding transcriptional regulator YafY
VPVEFDTRAKGYSIPSGAFGPPSDLTAEEALSIWALTNSVGSQPKLPFFEPAQTATKKLAQKLPPSERRKFRRATKAVSFLPLKLSELAAKTPFYQLIIDAIEKQRSLQIDYSSLTEWETIETTVNPYRLLFCEHSWYIVGHSSMHKEIRTFNVARIQSLTVLRKRFSNPKTFSIEKRIGDAWTMIPERGPNSHVVVRFAPMVAKNVEQVKWHKSQRTTFMPDGSLIFQVTVSGLGEVAWWILRYGDQAEALRPLKLRRIIAQRARKMATMYQNTI